jgi:hypothetical protein
LVTRQTLASAVRYGSSAMRAASAAPSSARGALVAINTRSPLAVCHVSTFGKTDAIVA